MASPRDRIVAAIDQAERDAREDYQRGRGGHWAQFTLHGLAEDRDILRRHAPIWIPGYSEDLGHLCRHDMTGDVIAEIAGRHGLMLSWDNCPEVLSVARRHGIDPEATPGDQA